MTIKTAEQTTAMSATLKIAQYGSDSDPRAFNFDGEFNIANRGIIEEVTKVITERSMTNLVVDPVMVATSGDRLIAQETVGVLVKELFPLAEVITPNLDEAGWLLGRSLQDADALEVAAWWAEVNDDSAGARAALGFAAANALSRQLFDDADRGSNATLTIDLENQEIRGPDGGAIKFEIDPFRKHCMLNGLDDIGLTMQKGKSIDVFEAKEKTERPWL